MSFFDNVSSFFGDIGDGIGSFFDSTVGRGFDWVSDQVSTVYGDLTGGINKIIDIPTHVADKVLDSSANIVNAVSKDVTQTIDSLGTNVQNIGSSFSYPLAIAGAIIGVTYLLGQKN